VEARSKYGRADEKEGKG